jgi:hypothetical protein
MCVKLMDANNSSKILSFQFIALFRADKDRALQLPECYLLVLCPVPNKRL